MQRHHFGPDLPKLAGLSDHDLFAMAHISSNLPSDPDIGRLRETTTLAAKLSLVGLHCSGVNPVSGHRLPCSASSPSNPMTTGGSVISRKASRTARPTSVAKAHGIENTDQTPLPSQGLAPALVLPIAVKSNNRFSLVLDQIYKAKVGGKSLRWCNIETRKDISIL